MLLINYLGKLHNFLCTKTTSSELFLGVVRRLPAMKLPGSCYCRKSVAEELLSILLDNDPAQAAAFVFLETVRTLIGS